MKASRWITLGAAAVGAAVIAPQLWTPAATAPAVAPRPVEPARAEPATDFARLLRRDSMAEQTGRGMFPAPVAQPRPASRKPVATPVVETPAATVPKFPYRWAGRIDVGRALKQAYFMRSNGELVAVLPGDVIDGLWRIERLTGEQVEVTYVPLAASLQLALAELSAERGASAPSAQDASRIASSSQIGPGAPERAAIESRPVAPERGSVAGGPARLVGGAVASAASVASPAGQSLGAPAAAAAQPAATPAAKLGGEVPTAGSMPGGPGNAERGGLTVADAMARGIAGGTLPTGRLGGATPTGRLGAD